MFKLSLWFSVGNSPSLVESCFYHSNLTDPQLCIRGKLPYTRPSHGTFQWTPAVRAISVLLLRHCARAVEDSPFVLSGESRSLAATLDYSLSKQPGWLLDMFGVDSAGRPLILKYIKRANSERKRPGPVEVSFTTRLRLGHELQVYYGNERLVNTKQLESLASQIENSILCSRQISPAAVEAGDRISNGTSNCNGVAQSHESPDPIARWHKELPRVYEHEVLTSLLATDIFTRGRQKRRMQEIISDPIFSRYIGKDLVLTDEVGNLLSSEERLGFHNRIEIRKLLAKHPLRIALPNAATAPLAMFTLMRDSYGLDISTYTRYLVSSGIAKQLAEQSSKEPINGCIVSLPAASMLIRAGRLQGYTPLMIMPSTSHRIILPKGSPEKSRKKSPASKVDLRGDFILTADPVTTSSMLFDDLKRRGEINAKDSRITNTPPEEISNAVRDLQVGALAWFPYYSFNVVTNNCAVVETSSAYQNSEMVLFLQTSCVENKKFARLLNVAIRDAWLELIHNSQARRNAVSTILADEDYLRHLNRGLGLHNFIKAPDSPYAAINS